MIIGVQDPRGNWALLTLVHYSFLSLCVYYPEPFLMPLLLMIPCQTQGTDRHLNDECLHSIYTKSSVLVVDLDLELEHCNCSNSFMQRCKAVEKFRVRSAIRGGRNPSGTKVCTKLAQRGDHKLSQKIADFKLQPTLRLACTRNLLYDQLQAQNELTFQMFNVAHNNNNAAKFHPL